MQEERRSLQIEIYTCNDDELMDMISDFERATKEKEKKQTQVSAKPKQVTLGCC